MDTGCRRSSGRRRSAPNKNAVTGGGAAAIPDRPELGTAIRLARLTGATLVIARLDRLSRNAAFLLTLKDGGVAFLACDMPEANDLTVGVMALVAQQEREAISRRTKEALAAARARGVTLGNPNGAAALHLASPQGAAALKRVGTSGAALEQAVARNADAHAATERNYRANLDDAGTKFARAASGSRGRPDPT